MIKNQNGQALLIIVLIMVIALTVGLSVVSRSITNLRTSTEQANSQKALSAAEAGIEQALKNSANVGGSFTGNTSYNTTITSVSGKDIAVNGGQLVAKDDGVYVWLTSYSSNFQNLFSPPYWNGTLTIYWGSSNDVCSPDLNKNTTSALEVAVITGTRTAPVMTRYAFDPCSRSNNFSIVSASSNPILGRTYNYKASVNITNGILARIIPLYASTFVAVSGGVKALPVQGAVASSTGTSDTVQRKVDVFQGFPELPSELFPYSLFSP